LPISRLVNPLRSANWDTLGLELVVVVVGLYLAFQVDRWTDNWKASRKEAVYLAQLHEELAAVDASTAEAGGKYRETVEQTGEVLSLLMQPVGSGPLSDDQCQVMFTLSVMMWRPVTVVSVEEMVSNGVLSELDDAELRRLLFALQSETHALSAYMAYVGARQNILMDDYPELMPRGIDANREMFMRCDADGMRRSQPFINHLASNRGRYVGVSSRWNDLQKILHDSHVRLDALLGIVHR